MRCFSKVLWTFFELNADDTRSDNRAVIRQSDRRARINRPVPWWQAIIRQPSISNPAKWHVVELKLGNVNLIMPWKLDLSIHQYAFIMCMYYKNQVRKLNMTKTWPITTHLQYWASLISYIFNSPFWFQWKYFYEWTEFHVLAYPEHNHMRFRREHIRIMRMCLVSFYSIFCSLRI